MKLQHVTTHQLEGLRLATMATQSLALHVEQLELACAAGRIIEWYKYSRN